MASRLVQEVVRDLEREIIVDIFERHGFAVYDSESTAELRDALLINIDDGTILYTEVFDAL